MGAILARDGIVAKEFVLRYLLYILRTLLLLSSIRSPFKGNEPSIHAEAVKDSGDGFKDFSPESEGTRLVVTRVVDTSVRLEMI